MADPTMYHPSHNLIVTAMSRKSESDSSLREPLHKGPPRLSAEAGEDSMFPQAVEAEEEREAGEEESRHLALRFYEALADGQFEQLGMMRAQFFRLLELQHKKKVKGDLKLLLKLLNALTSMGNYLNREAKG